MAPSPQPAAQPYATAPVPPAPRKSEPQPGIQHLLRNLRVFGLVFAGMILLLVISIVVLNTIWSVRDRELSSPARPDLMPTSAPPGRLSLPSIMETGGVNVAVMRPLELDTERIRRAAFLAKHAQSLEAGGSMAEAIDRYREALDVWPHMNAVWGQLGRAYLRTREFGKAQLALEKAVQGSPGTAELMNDLGAALLYQGQVQRALDLFEAAVEIDPLFAPAQFNLALCHMARNDRVAARQLLQQYLRLKPRDARALRERAFLDALEGQYETALSSLESALREMPDWPLLYFDASAVSALMGRMDQAISFLQKAEPLSSPRAVYQIYREPAFREIRLTELGKEFEHDLANRARSRMAEEQAPVEINPPSEPLFSTEAGRPR
ncbi:MAG TPA: tetratricopeptide repeat protein [Kiritimatiellia bacterium]|nr:tetratricopeptide repeat protein [Kiritimatiellia bacterium]